MDIRHKRTVKLPDIPPEVWICIFQHATYAPGEQVPEVYDEYDPLKLLPIRDRHAPLRKALLTKRALVRVCKQWYHLAMPYLYQSVYIGRTRSIESLTKGLKLSARDKTRPPLAAYIHRLDVAIRDHRDNRRGNELVNSDTRMKPLADLISLMTDLTIVSFAITEGFANRISDSILDALGSSAPSLRVLDFTAGPQEPSCARLANLLTRCPRLRVLTAPVLAWSNDKTQCHVPPSVTTLKVNMLATWPDAFTEVTSSFNWEEPPGSALRTLTIEGQKDHVDWAEFLRCCSDQLHSLHFRIPERRRIDVEGSIAVIARTCPNLRRLIITADRFPSIYRSNHVLPPVTYLGLRVTYHQCPKKDFEDLFSLLEELKTSTPSLQVVQLLNRHNVERLLKGHPKFALRKLQPYLEGNPFRIEDEDGVFLIDKLRELGYL